MDATSRVNGAGSPPPLTGKGESLAKARGLDVAKLLRGGAPGGGTTTNRTTSDIQAEPISAAASHSHPRPLRAVPTPHSQRPADPGLSVNQSFSERFKSLDERLAPGPSVSPTPASSSDRPAAVVLAIQSDSEEEGSSSDEEGSVTPPGGAHGRGGWQLQHLVDREAVGPTGSYTTALPYSLGGVATAEQPLFDLHSFPSSDKALEIDAGSSATEESDYAVRRLLDLHPHQGPHPSTAAAGRDPLVSTTWPSGAHDRLVAVYEDDGSGGGGELRLPTGLSSTGSSSIDNRVSDRTTLLASGIFLAVIATLGAYLANKARNLFGHTIKA